MSTRTTTRQSRMRSFSLSLVSAYSSPLLNLPVELLMAILDLTLLDSKASALGTVSKDLTRILNTVIYHTVTLKSAKIASLFIRVAHVNPALLSNIRHLVMSTEEYLPPQTWTGLWNSLPHCKGLLSLALSDVSYVPMSPIQQRYDSLASVTIRQFSELLILSNPLKSSSLSRLRICEPSDIWHSPTTMLASFDAPQQLSHLQLPRRLNGNEENDLVFVNEVKQILLDFPNLRMLVVSLFPSWAGDDVDVNIEESSIGQMLRGVDERVVTMKGAYDEWMISPWDRLH